jgi:hypothetical protein
MTEVRVSPAEVEVAAAEVTAVRAAATDPVRRDLLEELLGSLERGSVGADQAVVLEGIVDLGLHTGRIRALHGPGGESAALRLHRRLPTGAAAVASCAETSAALSALAGRELEGVAVDATGPGRYTLTLTAGGRTLSVRLDRNGARLASVEA